MGSPAKEAADLDQIRAAEALVVRLGRLGESLSKAFDDVLDTELPGNTPLIALMVLEAEGPSRPRQLQQVTGLTSGGLSKLLLRLEEAGLVLREFGTVPGDRRGAVVSLTPKGESAAREIAGVVLARLDEIRALVRDLDLLVGQCEGVSGAVSHAGPDRTARR